MTDSNEICNLLLYNGVVAMEKATMEIWLKHNQLSLSCFSMKDDFQVVNWMDYNPVSIFFHDLLKTISSCQNTLTLIYLTEIHKSISTSMVESQTSLHILEQSWPDFLDKIKSDWRKAANEFARFAFKVMETHPPSILQKLPYDLRNEIIQLTIIHFVENECRVLRNYSDEGKPFKSWFYQVAYRKALDILREKIRKDKRFIEFQKEEEDDFNIFEILENPSERPDAEVNKREILEVVAEVLRMLKIKCQLLILGSASGFQAKQLALLLGLGPQGNITASNDLRACRDRMKTLLSREGINIKGDII